MIYTITLNPSLDYVMYMEGFKEGELNRAQTTQKFPGGKGINVSRVLHELGVDATALGFIGGYPGAMIEKALGEAGIKTDFIQVNDDTRMNVKLKDHCETEINAPGPKVTDEQRNLLFNQIKQTQAEDIVTIAGSIPSSLSSDIYAEMAEIVKQTGAQLVVDAEKHLMQSILPYRPLMIKPNLKELEEMFGVKIEAHQDILHYGQKLIEQGAQSVLVSLGGDGAIYVDQDSAYHIVAPKGEAINTVGSGDSTVAGFLAGLATHQTLEGTLQLAIASGSATAFKDDLANKEEIDVLKRRVEIKILTEEGV